MIAAGGTPVARHWAHIVVFGAWFAVVVMVLLVDHIRSRWRCAEESVETEPTAASAVVEAAVPVRVSMATWPPQWAPVTPVRRAPTPVVARGVWLVPAVAGSLVAAAMHVIVLPEHVRESYLYAAFFAAAASSQLGFAWLLVRWPGVTLLRAGVAGNSAVILLWAYTRVVAVPLGPGAGHTEAVGALDLVATTGEVMIVVSCAFALLRLRAQPLGSTTARPFKVPAFSRS